MRWPGGSSNSFQRIRELTILHAIEHRSDIERPSIVFSTTHSTLFPGIEGLTKYTELEEPVCIGQV